MQGAFHRTLCLSVVVLAAMFAGCATTIVDVAFNDREAFTGHRTWDWLSRSASLDAAPSEEPSLAALTSRLVVQELQARGFVRIRRAQQPASQRALSQYQADLLVSYQLRIERELVAVNETGAETLLSSHHYSPSYQIQTTQQRVDIYDSGHLRVLVTDRRSQRVIWRGDLWGRHPEAFSRHLPAAVSRLLEQLPQASDPRGAPDPVEPEQQDAPPDPPGGSRLTWESRGAAPLPDPEPPVT